MSEYKSKKASINHNVDLVFSKLSNPGTIGNVAERLPEKEREALKNVSFTEDSIVVKGTPIGDMTLRRTEAVAPNRIVFEAEQSPVPFKISFNLEADGDNATMAEAVLDVNIPVFLRPMVNGPLEQASQRFGELLETIPFDKL